MNRLIGHVQMNDVALGYDTGFRVCAYLRNGGIVGEAGDDTELIKNWLESSVKEKSTAQALKLISTEKRFEIRLSWQGYSDIEEAEKIAY